MNSSSLPDLKQQITHLESELQSLRKKYAEKERHLKTLKQKREGVQTQLRKVEGQITTLRAAQAKDGAKKAAPSKKKSKKASKKPVTAKASSTAKTVSLPSLIVSILREAKGPLTAKQITDEVTRRGYTSTSTNFVNIVETRLKEMKKKGLVGSPANASGYISGTGKATSAASTSNVKKAKPSAKKSKQSKKPTPSASASTSTSSGAGEPPTLREILTGVLKKARRPLGARELSERTVAEGYKSQSGNLTNVVRVALNKMDNVEWVKGEGYTLKRGKG